MRRPSSRYNESSSLRMIKGSNDTSATRIEEPQECRICFDQDDPSKQMLAPCSCTGSIKHVHKNCMKEWIIKSYATKTRDEKKNLMSQGIECEMCKVKIPITFQKEAACVACKDFKYLIEINAGFFVVLMLLLFGSLIAGGYITYYLITNGFSFGRQSLIESVTVITGLVLLVILVVVALYYLFSQFIIRTKINIINIGRSPPYLKKNSVAPELIVQDVSDDQQ